MKQFYFHDSVKNLQDVYRLVGILEVSASKVELVRHATHEHNGSKVVTFTIAYLAADHTPQFKARAALEGMPNR